MVVVKIYIGEEHVLPKVPIVALYVDSFRTDREKNPEGVAAAHFPVGASEGKELSNDPINFIFVFFTF